MRFKKTKLEKTLIMQGSLGGICVFGNQGKCKPKQEGYFDRYICIEGAYNKCSLYKMYMDTLAKRGESLK